MKNSPPYAITSVDSALHLAQLLQQEGSLSVSQAADLLGVARSTAHRLLAMLVYRDFAEQGGDRRYRPGPLLGSTPVRPALDLRKAALPHLERLVELLEETVSLQVLVGTSVRFVVSVECRRALRVGDRSGKVLPAERVAGGKALLALLPRDDLTARYVGGDVDLARLRKQLALVRTRGFAVNDRETEDDVTAIGVPVLSLERRAVAALSVALPSARFRRAETGRYVEALQATAALVGTEMAAAGPSGGDAA